MEKKLITCGGEIFAKGISSTSKREKKLQQICWC
jgi:hypothetical protein